MICALLIAAPASAQGWNRTKNIADDIIYQGHAVTLYCGCAYASHGDSDGSGDIVQPNTCGYVAPQSQRSRASRVEWEHIVPASLMPARQFACWAGPGGSRERCEDEDPAAQAMIFDLHNLAPAIGQVNALRGNDHYAELSDDVSDFGMCPIEDTRGAFEPADCTKGDVARVWMYMRDAHGVVFPDGKEELFLSWMELDPVSPWESEREARIARYSRVNNPYVADVETDEAGACPWEW